MSNRVAAGINYLIAKGVSGVGVETPNNPMPGADCVTAGINTITFTLALSIALSLSHTHSLSPTITLSPPLTHPNAHSLFFSRAHTLALSLSLTPTYPLTLTLPPGADCVTAGINGFIMVDLPVEEGGEVLAMCAKHSLSFVPLIAPTSTDGPTRPKIIRSHSIHKLMGFKIQLPHEIVNLVKVNNTFTILWGG